MLYIQFQRPWQTGNRLYAEQFVCQIVGLQGCTRPRRGTWRLGGSGDSWPFKIGASPPFESPEDPGKAAGRPWVGLTPGHSRVVGLWSLLSFCAVARSASGRSKKNMVTTQSHVPNAQMLYSHFQSPL